MENFLSLFDFFKSKIRYIFLIYTIFTIYMNSKNCFINYVLLIFLDVILIIYSFIFLNKKQKYPFLFIIISTIVYAFIWLFGHCDNIYYFIILDDIFEIKADFKKKLLVAIHSSAFMMVTLKNLIFKNYDLHEILSSIAYSIIIYMAILFVFIFIHKFKDERDKLKILNSNLIEYSFNEREFLLSEERNRISQELHDSIGHSLMALSMNIKYLKGIKNRSNINEELDNMDKVIKESVQTLRSTVYNLKKLDECCDLKKEVYDIIKKFNRLDIVKINFDCASDIEKSTTTIKNTLIKTIKEGITNSLKHGNPTEINVTLTLVNSYIKLIIQDNGVGCQNIKPSAGLNGIKKRIEALNGKVAFESKARKGFTIETEIPGGF
ncbi:sensor histidine kinase [Clostridium acetobutylicum]|uniref:histidine kinase n=1 Tax=Clostridium acetobutylicum (strain ATCC 824 / DSM 792 / JCM 1419 / IAM 19013 / LMG 5710 / NBRC 13948 / NRRL B-527 / VKM B-1787 / 2291 / W) TaxID=272562 RepID=Q97GW2_CLOAB|nr:sensor histidine kinase [Clostridium acetobutylicum]AAK80210.1 Membrane-associated sensory histidine kinase-like ATPase [Clostridium acetobutylicum ATCC 824]